VSAEAPEPEEFARRRRLMQLLRERDADVYVSDRPADIRYLTGSEEAAGVVLAFADGTTELVVAAIGLAAATATTAATLVSAPGVGDALDPLVADRVLANGAERVILAVGGTSQVTLGTAIAAIARLELDARLGEELRRQKSPGERALLRRAASQCDAGLAAAFAALRPGVSELEVAAAVEAAIRVAGAEGTAFATNLASGGRGSFPNARASDKLLALGELGFLDLGPLCGGYHADAARTFVLGSPTRTQTAIVEAVLSALAWALRALEPGILGHEVYRGVAASLAASGFEGPMPHHAGHGLGLFGAERPWMLPGSQDDVRIGDHLALEVGVYVPYVGGARIEQDIIVTASGYELLTMFPLDPVVSPTSSVSLHA